MALISKKNGKDDLVRETGNTWDREIVGRRKRKREREGKD
jgi:hypothetical protein